jgi:hypothetical protein
VHCVGKFSNMRSAYNFRKLKTLFLERKVIYFSKERNRKGLCKCVFICKDKINLHVCVGLSTLSNILCGIFNSKAVLLFRFLYSLFIFILQDSESNANGYILCIK